MLAIKIRDKREFFLVSTLYYFLLFKECFFFVKTTFSHWKLVLNIKSFFVLFFTNFRADFFSYVVECLGADVWSP